MTVGVEAPIPVLLYHAVSDLPPADQVHFTVPPSRFAEHVRAIADAGRVPLTIAELGAALRGEHALPTRSIAVTFDDGFCDTPAAAAQLAGHGISSSVFIETGRLSDHPARLPASALAELLDIEGVEVGAHTVTHPYLDELRPAHAAREIVQSKVELEDCVRRPVRSFAYPHGAYDRRVRQAVIEAGFTAAAAVKNAFCHAADDSFAIARWTVMDHTQASDIAALLEGRGAPIAWSRPRLRTVGYKHARRLRRRLRGVAGPADRDAGER